jgi:hypothetical protein
MFECGKGNEHKKKREMMIKFYIRRKKRRKEATVKNHKNKILLRDEHGSLSE